MQYLILILLTLVTGCVSFPEEMEILKVSVEIIDYKDNDYFKVGKKKEPISAPTIEIKFVGSAPFAYMKNNGYLQQMRCYIYKSDTEYNDNNQFGRVYFDNMKVPENSTQSYDEHYGNETIQYTSYSYRGLRARTTVNGSEDFDLIKSDYSHIECGLWGVTMLGPHVRSNVIKIYSTEVIDLYQQYLAKPKFHNIKKLSAFINENKTH
jgi:hypothetical protein